MKCGSCADRFPDRPATRLGEVSVYAGWEGRAFKVLERSGHLAAARDRETAGRVDAITGQVHRSRLVPSEGVAGGARYEEVVCRTCRKRIRVSLPKARSMAAAGVRAVYVWPNGRHATAS